MRAILKTAFALALLCFSSIWCQAVPVRVFAAASLTEAFKDIGDAYLRDHPTDPVEFSFAGSPTLRTQIQEGAPVDVFASADHPNMEALAAQHLVGPQQIFARNSMVIVVPAGSTQIAKPSDLATKGLRIVLAGSKVPAGHYAEQILAKMTPAVADNFSSLVMANVVSRESDVKAVLAKVVLGEADAGFVFATDAAAAGQKVRVIPISPQYNVIAEYPIAAVAASNNMVGARIFINFVLSSEGQAILRAHGFMSPQAAH